MPQISCWGKMKKNGYFWIRCHTSVSPYFRFLHKETVFSALIPYEHLFLNTNCHHRKKNVKVINSELCLHEWIPLDVHRDLCGTACLRKCGSEWCSKLGVCESAELPGNCLLWHTLGSSNRSCHTKPRPDGKCSGETFLFVTMAADSRGKATFDCSRWHDLCLSWPDQNWNSHRLANTCKGHLWSWEISLWQGAIPAAAGQLKCP